MVGDWGDRPRKTYESNFIQHDFVLIEKLLSRYKAIFLSIVLSQQCCEVYFISLAILNPLRDLTTKYYWIRPPNLRGWIRSWIWVLLDNFTAGFLVRFIMTVFVPDIEGFQNKAIWLRIRTTCSVNVTNTCSANLYDISRRNPSRSASILKIAYDPENENSPLPQLIIQLVQTLSMFGST